MLDFLQNVLIVKWIKHIWRMQSMTVLHIDHQLNNDSNNAEMVAVGTTREVASFWFL